ncbi:hypothetical protein BV22DRAFT_496570 [Leucogyrophana mollusca]|uniref:Uncharacterized protein n=1 Tax=Leucogyrophana mollusca TaxID=85980 RepID=A0ACB8BIK5_9AGAM|nr:hypothetical protein BV22DRAFT_496570 [Leucogyrophana mollusca]
MAPQVDPATFITLAILNEDDIGQKLRVAGRMLTYDPETAVVLLYDAPHALLVDASLCFDTDALLSSDIGRAESDGDQGTRKRSKDRNINPRWARDRKSYVWVVGYLERADPQIPIPILPAYLPPPDIDASLIMRALSVTPASNLKASELRSVLWEMGTVPPTPYPV